MYLSYYNYIIFIPMLMITNFLMLICSSWFSMWMIMEINLINFISLISFDKNIKHEILMNYFLIQAFNSHLFMMSMIMLNYYNIEMIYLLMNLSMLTKLGMPPFYLWYLKMMNNLNWMNIFFLSTFQKIIPLIILNNILNYSISLKFTMLILLISSILASLYGLNTKNLKIIICYSSMVQMSWIISISLINEMIMMIYFLIYLFISFNLMILFKMFNCKYLINLYFIKLNNKFYYYLINFSVFSLASLPPLFGFLMKLLSLLILSNQMKMIYLLFLIFSSLISMFFYLRLLFHMIMLNSNSMKLNYKFVNFSKNLPISFLLIKWFLIIMFLVYELT
uniref:NADH-ubiquinone oxidoreductase chain 2 n=1 Tax=Apocrypta bakeri TaxID=490712 RepID=A0A8A1S244_APOBA|nr:NADH dehydrogenase subunit 2 [Apocrypta bakeri]